MNECERSHLTAIFPYSKPCPPRYHRTNLRRKTLCWYPAWDFHCSRRECFTSWRDCTFISISLSPSLFGTADNNRGISPETNRIWIGKMNSHRLFSKHHSPKSLNWRKRKMRSGKRATRHGIATYKNMGLRGNIVERFFFSGDSALAWTATVRETIDRAGFGFYDWLKQWTWLALSFVQGLFSEWNTIADVRDDQEISSIDDPLSWGKIRPKTRPWRRLLCPFWCLELVQDWVNSTGSCGIEPRQRDHHETHANDCILCASVCL